MASIEILNSQRGSITLEHFQSELNLLKCSDFFGNEEIRFCEALSRELMKIPGVRAYPELVALAFWLRKGELLKLKESQRGIRKPRGLAFHIPPANVDTIFLYSWIISVLSGNCNVVRISNRAGRATGLILSALESLFSKDFEFLAKNNFFVKYSHNDEIMNVLSSLCDLRVVWGGDQTVRSVRKFPVKPRALDVGFADRFSAALIKSESILSASEEVIKGLCSDFYNDAYLFNQKACSSPKVLFWYGEASANAAAKKKFFSILKDVTIDKKFVIDEPFSMYKLKTAFRGAIDEQIIKTTFESAALVHHDMVWTGSLSKARALEFGGGSFCSIDFHDLEQLHNLFGQKDQTLTYFGFKKQDMIILAQSLEGLGIDRIVPVGTALKFNTIWDGLDLFQTFSREIYVE